ncbi:MAG TPA: DUF2752 domain-containing protein [Pyrinomonadaceae bacterium]|nr:DUF2752 domain-containing protein [Pyrinomonadaceae bacterium]
MPPATLSQTGFFPLATTLRNRRFGLVLMGALVVHFTLSLLGLPGWQCAFFRLTGVPCPGCGLTRACMLLVKGDVRDAIVLHAFAPIFVLLIAILILATVLPKSLTEPFILKAEILERQTGITIIILTGLILYWLARLVLLQATFTQLIRG